MQFFQVHTQQGQALQMRRVWKGLLPEQDVGRTQDSTSGGVTAQVSGVLEELQPAEQSQDPLAHALGGAAGSQGRGDTQRGFAVERETDVGSREGLVAKQEAHDNAKTWIQHRGHHEALKRLESFLTLPIYKWFISLVSRYLVF